MRTIDGDDDSYDEINKNHYKIWCNAAGECHRDGDLPAVIWLNGSIEYYKDGKIHRDGDLPAEIWSNGSVHYVKYGKRHRDGDLPAVIYAGGSVEYWIDGVKQK